WRGVIALPSVLRGVWQGASGAVAEDFAGMLERYPRLAQAARTLGFAGKAGMYGGVNFARLAGALLTPLRFDDIAALGFRGAWAPLRDAADWSKGLAEFRAGWAGYGRLGAVGKGLTAAGLHEVGLTGSHAGDAGLHEPEVAPAVAGMQWHRMLGSLEKMPQAEFQQLFVKASGILQPVMGMPSTLVREAGAPGLRQEEFASLVTVAYMLHTQGETAAQMRATALATELGATPLHGLAGGAPVREMWEILPGESSGQASESEWWLTQPARTRGVRELEEQGTQAGEGQYSPLSLLPGEPSLLQQKLVQDAAWGLMSTDRGLAVPTRSVLEPESMQWLQQLEPRGIEWLLADEPSTLADPARLTIRRDGTTAYSASAEAVPLPGVYERAHPVLDLSDNRPAKRTRWVPAQTADQPGPSSMPHLPGGDGYSLASGDAAEGKAGGETDATLAFTPAPLPHPDPPSFDIHDILELLEQDNTSHIGLPHTPTHAPDAPAETAFGLEEPDVSPAPSGHLEATHAIPGPSRSPHPQLPPGWLKNLRHDLKNGKADFTPQMTKAWRQLIQKGYLKPGMRLPSRDNLVRQLQHPGINRKTVQDTYRQLRGESLLRSARVTGPAEHPLPVLPADWLAKLRRGLELEKHPLLEQTLRKYILNLPPRTQLPSHEEMAELLEIPKISPSAVLEVYRQLAHERLLIVDGNERTWLTETTGQLVADPHPRLPLDWMENLHRTLENNPKPAKVDHQTWLAQALHTHIKPLTPGTRLPTRQELTTHLKDVGVTERISRVAYSQLADKHLLVSKGNKGTYVVDPGERVGQAAKSGASKTTETTLPTDWIENLRHTLENNPKPAKVDHKIWLAQALHIHIKPLTPGTCLPAYKELSIRLKDLKLGSGSVRRAYDLLKKAGQLTSEFGNGTWVANPKALLEQARGSRSSQGAEAALPGSSRLEGRGLENVAEAEPSLRAEQLPQRPQMPAHTTGATDNLDSIAAGSESAPTDSSTAWDTWTATGHENELLTIDQLMSDIPDFTEEQHREILSMLDNEELGPPSGQVGQPGTGDFAALPPGPSVRPPLPRQVPLHHELLAPYSGKFHVQVDTADPKQPPLVAGEADGDSAVAPVPFAAQLGHDGLLEVWHAWSKEAGIADRLVIDPRTDRLVAHVIDARDDYAAHPLADGEWHIDYGQSKATHIANGKETGLTATVQLRKGRLRLVDSRPGQENRPEQEKEYVKQLVMEPTFQTMQKLTAGGGTS
ncbi:MAG: hypothetical protein JO362_01600, partial [Streptomycetaceae bacterium]|nr:hypothetical protein [Streptomycetaceae bacterium]